MRITLLVLAVLCCSSEAFAQIGHNARIHSYRSHQPYRSGFALPVYQVPYYRYSTPYNYGYVPPVYVAPPVYPSYAPITGRSMDLGGGITRHSFSDGSTGTSMDLGGGIMRHSFTPGYGY